MLLPLEVAQFHLLQCFIIISLSACQIGATRVGALEAKHSHSCLLTYEAVLGTTILRYIHMRVELVANAETELKLNFTCFHSPGKLQ